MITRHQSKTRRSKAVKSEPNVDQKSTPVPGQNPEPRLKALGGGDYDLKRQRQQMPENRKLTEATDEVS